MLLLPTAYFTEGKIDLLNLVTHLFFSLPAAEATNEQQ